MNKDMVYLDNSAVTRIDEKVLEAMKPYFFDTYAVATSEFAYSMGIDAKEALEEARSTIADSLNASPGEIVFTSGSTESSNMAIKGVTSALKKKGKHLIVSKIEDFPVLNTAKALEKQGFEIDFIEVDNSGRLNTEQLAETITDETVLVSIQHANQ